VEDGVSQPQKVRPTSLNFVRDKAAEQDAFGSHDRLATTIAGVIRSNEEIKVIGLLGRWGSGKSTVVSKIETELKASEGGQTFHTFCYDAWLHQSDPQRRSFLEKFLRYLIAEKLTTEKEWKDELNKLTRNVEESEIKTTPVLSLAGMIAIVAGLILAVVMQFVGFDAAEAAFGEKPTAFGLWFFWGGLVALIATIVLAAIAIRVFASSGDGQSVFAPLVNKAVETVRNRTIRDPEPTAIEFQNVFARIMTAVRADNRHFVIVLDNLDRLHAQEALAMWGTVRSFFLGPNQENRALLPTVILPVDEEAIRQIYKVEYGDLAPAAAEAFMEKTFDLTFHVPPPVATGWQAYLEKQLSHVFEEHLDPLWVFPVTRILEAKWRGQAITPRKINMAVNAIAALWLQRGDEVSMPAIAYFCAFRPDGEATVVSDILNPRVAVSHFDPDWQKGIAALHYGVALEDAVQVLLRDRITAALGQGKEDSFKELADVKGFPTVLRHVLDESQTSPSMIFVENTAIYMSRYLAGDEQWKQNAWESVRRMALACPDWSRIDEDTVEAVGAMLKLGGAHSLRETVNGIADKLGRQSQASAYSEADYGELVSFARMIADACEAIGNPPRIKLDDKAATYLDLIALASDAEPAMKIFQTTAKADDVRAELIRGMQNRAGVPNAEPRLAAALKLNLKISWAGVIQAARVQVDQHGGGDDNIRIALICLGHFVRLGNAEAVKQVKELTDSGILSQRASEAAEAGKYDELARMTALLIPNNGGVDVPNDWGHHLAKMPTLPALVEGYLPENLKPELMGLDHCASLVAATRRTPGFMTVAKQIVSQRVRNEDLGILYVDQVIADLGDYLNCVEQELQRDFILQLSNYDSFWEGVDKVPFGTHVMRLLSELATEDEDSDQEQRGKARAMLGAKLSNVSVGDWEGAVRKDGNLLPTALSYVHLGKAASVAGGALDTALNNLMADLIAAFDEAARKRWFEATDILSTNTRKTLLKNLRDKINGGATVPDLTGLLDIGGSAFLKNGEFAKDADSSARHVVLPLISEPGKLDWLMENRVVHKAWVAASSAETKGVLSERINAHWQGADETIRAKLETLLDEYGLPEPDHDEAPADLEQSA